MPPNCSIFLNENSNSVRRVLFQSHNRANATRNPTMHAEFQILRDLEAKKLDMFENDSERQSFIKSLELFVTMEPCIMCIGALRIVGIPKIYFNLRNPRFGGCGSIVNGHSLEFVNPNCIPQLIQIENEEIYELLKKFYKQTNFKCPEGKRRDKSKRN
ncbi:MAG: tRNA-specific adenosine deaminase 2, variant 2 [Marteilia pararefringens]